MNVLEIVCSSIVFAADTDPAARQLQVYPKNLARQNIGSNLFLYNAANQTYAPTEAAAAWLDEDITTGWPALTMRWRRRTPTTSSPTTSPRPRR